MTKFNDYINTNAEKLDLYTTAITRAHGKNHPEAFDVRDIYVRIQDKTQAAGEVQPDLNTEFTTLREISDNYTIPDDVCETYAAVYTMLKEADSLYLS
ncbi:iron-sulfur cluster repair di-iron protein, ric [Ruoffia sp. FAM 24228]|uniref:iron-sulfur cluster repair di-iron protein, ric n=1 Tax=Ruoffia sp. FAM 24228 TaxID=3259517 RepID=UPI0038886A53